MNIGQAKQEILNISHPRRNRRVRHSHRAAEAYSADGAARHREDGHHGAGGAGGPYQSGLLYDHAPHETERDWSAIYQSAELWREGIFGHGVYHERDYRFGLRSDRAERHSGGHSVSRRDQLRLGDARADDAAVPAVQDLRDAPRAGRFSHCHSRKSAAVQQVREGF